jgi:hypothetical protein
MIFFTAEVYSTIQAHASRPSLLLNYYHHLLNQNISLKYTKLQALLQFLLIITNHNKIYDIL